MRNENNKVYLKFPAITENERIARMMAAAFLSGLNPTIEEMDDVKTAVSEAVTNCIVHAYNDSEGMIQFDLWNKDKTLYLAVEDFGIGIKDVQKAMEPMYTTKPEDERTGMGFSFMEAFMDQVYVESEPGKGTLVVMRKRIGR